jgi:hypothetical protein
MTPVARKRMKGFDGGEIYQMILNESAKKSNNYDTSAVALSV